MTQDYIISLILFVAFSSPCLGMKVLEKSTDIPKWAEEGTKRDVSIAQGLGVWRGAAETVKRGNKAEKIVGNLDGKVAYLETATGGKALVNSGYIGHFKARYETPEFYIGTKDDAFIAVVQNNETVGLIARVAGDPATIFKGVDTYETLISNPVGKPKKLSKVSQEPTVKKIIDKSVWGALDKAEKTAKDIDTFETWEGQELLYKEKIEKGVALTDEAGIPIPFKSNLQKVGHIEIASPTGKAWKYKIVNTKETIRQFRKNLKSSKAVGVRLEEPAAPYTVHPTLGKDSTVFEREAYGTKKEADDAVLSVAKELEKRGSRVSDVRVSDRGTVRTVSESIAKYRDGFAQELFEKRRIDFKGKVLRKGREAQDLAQLWQVYRSPRIEKMSLIYRNDEGVILGHNMVTSGQLQYVAFKDAAQYLTGAQSTARRLGAAKIDIVHNHPGGNPRMSEHDMAFGQYMKKILEDQAGEFIVIDHGKFTKLVGTRKVGDKLGTYTPNPNSGRWIEKQTLRVSHPRQLAAFATEMNVPKGKIGLIYLGGNNTIQGWSIHDQGFFYRKPFHEVKKSILQQASAHDATRTAVIVENPYAFPSWTRDINKVGDFLIDIIRIDPKSGKAFSLRGAKKWAFKVPTETEEGEPIKSVRGRAVFEEQGEYKPTRSLKEYLNGLPETTVYKKKVEKGGKRATEMNDAPPSPEGFSMPTEGKGRQVFDLLQWKLQDRLNSLKKIQIAIEKDKKIQLTDDVNAYQTEEAYISKASSRIKEFEREHVDPLVETIDSAGYTLEDVEEFIYARHALEANERFKTINPDVENNTALSGMSNEEARGIVSRYGKDSKMQEIAKNIDSITGKTRKALVEGGLATAKEIEAWEKIYNFYVPLRREGKETALPKKGKGIDVGGKESKQRTTGSSQRRAVNILSNIIAQHEATLIRAEKAVVGRTLFGLVKENPNADLWEADAPELKPFLKQRKELDPETGLPVSLSEVVFGKDTLYKFKDNVLVVKIEGEEHTITLNEQNVHAQRIAKAMKNLGGDSSSAIINAMSTVNRYLAIMNTSANPEFLISNFFRDIQSAGYNINNTEAKGLKKKVFGDVKKAFLGARHGVRGNYDTEWARHYKEFEAGGGQTGWVDYYKNIESREKKLKQKFAALKPGTWPTTKRAIQGVFDFVSNENMAVENAIRLSIFVNLKDRIGTRKAISTAKNITVNFNRKGDAGQALNAFYLFYNASVQGNARLFQSLIKSPTARKLAYGTIAFAVVLDMANRAIGGEDDDGENRYDKIEPWIKEHNLIAMLPGGNYFKLPLPWGYNVLHVLGQVTGEAVDPNYKGKFSSIKSAGRLGSAILGSFNPMGSESTLLQIASPTAADPFVQWAENKKFSGVPIKPEQMPFDVPKPEYQMYWQNARTPSKWATRQLNNLTGGDEITPGLINLSPEIVDLFLDTALGGAGRFIDNTVSLPKTLTQEKIDVRKVPFVRRAFGQPSEYYTRSKFYDNLSEIRYAEKSTKHYRGTPQSRETKERYRKEQSFIMKGKNAKSRIAALNKRIKRITAGNLSKEGKRVRTEKHEMAIQKIMMQFNKRYLASPYN